MTERHGRSTDPRQQFSLGQLQITAAAPGVVEDHLVAIARLHHADLAGCWVELLQDAQRVLCLFGRQGQHHGSLVGEIMGLETVEFAEAAHRIAHRNGGLLQLDGNAGGAAPLVEHGGEAAAGGVAQGVRGNACLQQRFYLWPEGGAVALEIGAQLQGVAGHQDAGTVAADIPRHQDGVTGFEVAYRDTPALLRQREGAYPAGVDKDLVGRPLGHHLGVAADDAGTALGKLSGHRFDDTGEIGVGETLLDDKAGAQILGLGPHHGEIVDRAGDGQFADIAPLEEERRDGKAVGGEGDGAVYRQQGGIFTAQQDLVAKVAKEELVDQLVHLDATAAVAKLDFSHRSWIPIYR
ncbi:hypothetical protein AERO8C_170103 [Aeromonas veronii]|uniref:Uncharacterized protein n=1 Tax=Aeromonas veronii TaxID=654 RepID=A0A653KZM0_AERVE|nr:hypothetical protein AERO8C_170103 [Aeromonas veronii]